MRLSVAAAVIFASGLVLTGGVADARSGGGSHDSGGGTGSGSPTSAQPNSGGGSHAGGGGSGTGTQSDPGHSGGGGSHSSGGGGTGSPSSPGSTAAQTAKVYDNYFACASAASGAMRLVSANVACGASEGRVKWDGSQPAEGKPGPTGPKGPAGAQGPTGEKGSIGEKGAAGDKGPVGDKGAVGDRGATGLSGSKGATGDKGLTGDKGATGDKGPVGDQGPVGAPGGVAAYTVTGGVTTFNAMTTVAQLTALPAGTYFFQFTGTVIHNPIAPQGGIVWCALRGVSGNSQAGVSWDTPVDEPNSIRSISISHAAALPTGGAVYVECQADSGGHRLAADPQMLYSSLTAIALSSLH